MGRAEAIHCPLVSYQCVPLDGLVQFVEQLTSCPKVEQAYNLSRDIPNCTCQLQILKYNELHNLELPQLCFV